MTDGSCVPLQFLCHFLQPLSLFLKETCDWVEKEDTSGSECEVLEALFKLLGCNVDLLCLEYHL